VSKCLVAAPSTTVWSVTAPVISSLANTMPAITNGSPRMLGEVDDEKDYRGVERHMAD
jgi:hypothetical protein